MIFFFTDFGWQGPYVGQMTSATMTRLTDVAVVHLMHDAPAFHIQASSYLLAAILDATPGWLQPEAICVGVVDPGVGGERRCLAIETDHGWLVGPDNGLFELVLRKVTIQRSFELDSSAKGVSTSFHGRDVFAPAATQILQGSFSVMKELSPGPVRFPDWPDDIAEIIYIDAYGNAMTGLRGSSLAATVQLKVDGTLISAARTFSDADPDQPFYYVNSQGLIEIAFPNGSALARLGLCIGKSIEIVHSVVE